MPRRDSAILKLIMALPEFKLTPTGKFGRRVAPHESLDEKFFAEP
jgi:hypothetical protein